MFWFRTSLVLQRVPGVGFIQARVEKHGAVLRGELADTEEFAFTVFTNAGIGVHGVGTFWECGVLVDVVTNEGLDSLEE